jgi:hypothetical protein
MNNNELYHHGVIGMKWGIRRYQNKDGSLTSAGKRRSRVDSWSEDAKVARELKKKKVGQMSNAELRKLNERQQLERNYSNLNPSHVKKGLKFVGATASTMGTFLTLYNNSDKLIANGRKIGTKIINKLGHKTIN